MSNLLLTSSILLTEVQLQTWIPYCFLPEKLNLEEWTMIICTFSGVLGLEQWNSASHVARTLFSNFTLMISFPSHYIHFLFCFIEYAIIILYIFFCLVWMQFILPHLLGWQAFANTIKPEDSLRSNNTTSGSGAELEWGRWNSYQHFKQKTKSNLVPKISFCQSVLHEKPVLQVLCRVLSEWWHATF